MKRDQLLESLDLGEDQEIEFKSAAGGFPKSAWETVSAFANTEGGRIILGVTEKNDKFTVEGIRKPASLRKIFWDTHNNSQKLSRPICQESDVSILEIGNLKLLCIRIPRATRQQRPIYINGNPLSGTFKRTFEGDYRCSQDEVRLMLRDAGNDPFDGIILEGFTLGDLDRESITAYRNRFASRDPDHPFLALSDHDLLEQLGGWRRDRHSKAKGLTLAGLLMFGKERSLLDALPHFHLDYQEQLSSNPEVRWTYRLTIDGKWEPNLFNFYYRVYPRLSENIDTPFNLDKTSTRREETHVHEALREALVNTLVHADHQTTRSIKVIKRKDAFIFVNPGRLRISREQLYTGGVSDPRNPNLLKMFQMLGLGEKAGSGFQKILRAWMEQHWLMPLVSEELTLELTAVRLPLASMIPEAVEQELRAIVGEEYNNLEELDRRILSLACGFEEISNVDIQPYCTEHPKDIGTCLGNLVTQGWLIKVGNGRGTRYHLPRAKPETLFPGSATSRLISEHSSDNSEHSSDNSEHSPDNSEHSFPDEKDRLLAIATHVRSVNRVKKVVMESTILALCENDWLTLRILSELVNRKSDTLRNHYVNPMIKDGRLQAKNPDKPNHPEQAYRTNTDLQSNLHSAKTRD